MFVQIALLTLAPHAPKKTPKWMDYTIAGYALSYDEHHSALLVLDPKTRFFILRDVVCDGAYVTLELTRDRAEINANGGTLTQRGAKVELNYDGLAAVTKPLPHLATGKGVKIGDSMSAVKTKLGNPTKHGPSGSRDQFLDYAYLWKTSDTLFTETYTFKKGKLIQIVFVKDSSADNGSPGIP
jgi:hypothetical protein